MRTPRLESESSGETSGQSWRGGHALQHVEGADPHHRIGIGKPGPRQVDVRRRERADASSLSALARANAGALPSAATAASSAAASAWSVHAAWNASA